MIDVIKYLFVMTLQEIMSMPTHIVFVTSPNQSFLQLVFQLSITYMIKMTCSCIFNYKMVLNYRYDYDLQLLLVWMKMQMKNISSTIVGLQQYR
jgi:hypothetical protein